MRVVYPVLFFMMVSSLAISQALNDLQKRADSLYKAKDFVRAAQTYHTTLRHIQPDQSGLLFRARLSLAKSWTSANLPDSAFVHIGHMLRLKGLVYNNLLSLTTDTDLLSLHTESRWNEMIDKLFSNITKDTREPLDDSYTQEEIIYGRKDGMALTMLHLKPKKNPNGKAIIQIRSGGWGSLFYMPGVTEAVPFLQKGYSVFIVFHGSEPVYTVVDAIEDMQRAVRFIRYHAKKFSIDPDKIGAQGASAGGHLALMLGLSDVSAAQYSPDPVDRVSSKVQAVVSFSPTMNFVDWDGKGNNAFSAFLFKQFLVHVLEFRKWDASHRRFTYVKDEAEINEMLKQISPVSHVSANDAAIMIFHGDEDELVPIAQAELLTKLLKDKKLPMSYQMKKGGGHNWQRGEEENSKVMNWFAEHLK